jgi:iron-sulfur cluster repair protein YtfE (RIC family)
MLTTEEIDAEMTVNQAIQRVPGSIGVFNELGIDACCGGADTLAEAAARERIPLAELLETLRRLAEPVR